MAKPKLYIEASATGSKATIRIVDRINEWSDSSATSLREIVDTYINNGVADVGVYLNTTGGDCFQTEQMCNELERLPNKPIIEVGAVCASAGTYFLTRFPSVAHPNSQFMIHRPHMGTYGDVVTIQSNLKLLQNLNEVYKTAYSVKMNKTPDEIEALFVLGDYWMTAQEAKEMGLVDSVLNENEVVTEDTISILEACAAPIIPKINNLKKPEMDRLKLIAQLKLSADATEAQIEAALATLQTKAGQADALEAQAKTNLTANAKSLVDAAIADKKITADEQSFYLEAATNNFEATKKVFDSKKSLEKLSDKLDDNGEVTPEAQARKNWTMEDYMAKAPDALAEMVVKDNANFRILEAAYLAK